MRLNSGVLPPSYFALPEQNVRGPISDVLTLQLSPETEDGSGQAVGLAVATAPPPMRVVRRNEVDLYAAKADRITVRHRHGAVVAVIEIVSPGNKGSRHELRAFVQKTAELLRQNIHLLIVRPFSAWLARSTRNPNALWDEFVDEDFVLPADKPLTLAAYDAGPPRVAYVEPVGVGEALPNMPLFLKPEFYVLAPLETTYQATWNVFPAPLTLLDLPGDQPQSGG